ncbi:MAG: hypothetical protein AB1646_06045 [Thermodesulfobacteriota bacterium]
MKSFHLHEIVAQIDAIHRDLARISVERRLGTPSALTMADVFGLYPVPLQPKVIGFLRKAIKASKDADHAERLQRVLFACMDLQIDQTTAQLVEMLNFYMERTRMHVQGIKIPALEVVPWVQAESDFAKREEMMKECNIFFKAIANPVLTGVLDLTTKTVKERFRFDNYVEFSAEKKQISFDAHARVYTNYLAATHDAYTKRMSAWVNDGIGRAFDNLSRYHALHLLRITRYDGFFPRDSLPVLAGRTFSGLGFDIDTCPGVNLDLSDHRSKNPDPICVGVEIPGEIYVLMKPVGGLIDVEALLHELGHAFFLAHVDPALPMEYRRLYRSPALDEAFAFLFMDLVDNPAWLTETAGLPEPEAQSLAYLYQTKRVCLIRRHIGKFLSEKELHETGVLTDSSPYCRHMMAATGFVYEPEGYLIDMDPDFYALDYLRAWAGAHLLRTYLEERFGLSWFTYPEAGAFLKDMAFRARRYSLEQTLRDFCGEEPHLPEFTEP